VRPPRTKRRSVTPARSAGPAHFDFPARFDIPAHFDFPARSDTGPLRKQGSKTNHSAPDVGKMCRKMYFFTPKDAE